MKLCYVVQDKDSRTVTGGLPRPTDSERGGDNSGRSRATRRD
jgi:hypothetical protein